MPGSNNTPDLDVDLQGGMVPISKASSSLAALIKRSRERRQPIIVTQKGYPAGVLLPIELFSTLRELAERSNGARKAPSSQPAGEPAPAVEPAAMAPVDASPVPAEPSRPRGRGGRKAKAQP